MEYCDKDKKEKNFKRRERETGSGGTRPDGYPVK